MDSPSALVRSIVEDHVFIGSRCILVEGVIVEQGAVLGAQVCALIIGKRNERTEGKLQAREAGP